MAYSQRPSTDIPSSPAALSIMQKFSLVFVALALASAVYAAEVQFGTTKSCDAGSFSEDYQNVACNSCVDPPGDWQAILFSGLDSAQRWTGHNEDGCTSASQVAQGYGDACLFAGHTALRSAWVACDGQ